MILDLNAKFLNDFEATISQSGFLQELLKNKMPEAGKRLRLSRVEWIMSMVQISRYPKYRDLWEEMKRQAQLQESGFEYEYESTKREIERHRII